jgi:YD repeat-containing protein
VTNIQTNGGETTVAFGYDAANRKIWEEQTLAGHPTFHVQTDRDADGNRSVLAAPYFLVYYQYNPRNQLAHILDGNGNPFYDFGYDASGNLIHREARWWSGNVTNYQYDALNRASMAEHGTNDWIFARSWYQYDNVNREVATWREENNGIGGSRGERYWYNASNEVTSVRYNANEVWTGNPSDWRHSSDYNYTPDRLNRTSKVEDGNTSSYTASAMNQYTGQWRDLQLRRQL